MLRKVNIIGAGLAGLSAGIYLQQKGYETEIFELADWAGGVFASWVRKGFRFDGCIHWMVGTRPGDGFYKLYREVGLLEADTAIYTAASIKLEIHGTLYDVPMTINEFRAFLLHLSEQDSAKIEDLCRDVEHIMHSGIPTAYPSNPIRAIRFLSENRDFIKIIQKYMGITLKEYAQSFQSETIRALFQSMLPPEFSTQVLLTMLGTRMSGNAGYPMGGSLEALRRVEAKYRSLGGKISFRSKVEEIVVKNGRATAIRSNGELHPADAVVAACDVYDTLQNMLGGKYRHKKLETLLASDALFCPEMIVSFGLKKKFDIPYSMHVECEEGIRTSPDTVKHTFNIRSFDFDPSAAPQDQSSVMVSLDAPLEYWENLRNSDITAYKKRKQLLANDVADTVEQHFPGFKDAIVVTDVATPATYLHLTNLYKASFEGFVPTPALLKTRIKKNISGITNLFLCGQWTSIGGGICAAVASGKDAAKQIQNSLH